MASRSNTQKYDLELRQLLLSSLRDRAKAEVRWNALLTDPRMTGAWRKLRGLEDFNESGFLLQCVASLDQFEATPVPRRHEAHYSQIAKAARYLAETLRNDPEFHDLNVGLCNCMVDYAVARDDVSHCIKKSTGADLERGLSTLLVSVITATARDGASALDSVEKRAREIQMRGPLAKGAKADKTRTAARYCALQLHAYLLENYRQPLQAVAQAAVLVMTEVRVPIRSLLHQRKAKASARG